MKTYYIGLEDAGRRPYGYKQQPGLLIVHAVTDRDHLPPYLWVYIGKRKTTKVGLSQHIGENVSGFFRMIERRYGQKFNAVQVW